MPLPRSIPAGQTQFTAQRYRALLEQRGHRVPASLKKLTTQDDAQPELTAAKLIDYKINGLIYNVYSDEFVIKSIINNFCVSLII